MSVIVPALGKVAHVLSAPESAPKNKPTEREKAKEREAVYLRVMQQLEDSRETEEDREARKAEQTKKSREKAARNRKENNLRGRISWLRSRIMQNPMDKTARAEISMAKTQLYWLNNSFSSDGV